MSRAFCVSAVFQFSDWGELVCRMGLPVDGGAASDKYGSVVPLRSSTSQGGGINVPATELAYK